MQGLYVSAHQLEADAQLAQAFSTARQQETKYSWWPASCASAACLGIVPTKQETVLAT
jgi:hypothetical protein